VFADGPGLASLGGYLGKAAILLRWHLNELAGRLLSCSIKNPIGLSILREIFDQRIFGVIKVKTTAGAAFPSEPAWHSPSYFHA